MALLYSTTRKKRFFQPSSRNSGIIVCECAKNSTYPLDAGLMRGLLPSRIKDMDVIMKEEEEPSDFDGMNQN